MTLRLIEMVIPHGSQKEVLEVLQKCNTIEIFDLEMGNGLILFKVLLTTEDSESTLDKLEKRFSHFKWF
jgi:hypothetical protein